MRIPHILRDNETTQLPRNFLFFDTETESKRIKPSLYSHQLKLGTSCSYRVRDSGESNTEKWTTFEEVEDFWEWLEDKIRPKQKLFVYAHNMNFDFFVVNGLENLSERGYELDSWFIDSNVFILVAKKNGGKVLFLDTGNYLKIPLKDMGEAIGLEKLDVDFEDVSLEDLETYCKRDTEIVKKWVLSYRDFVDKHQLGCYKYTAASQSLQAFRHRFMNHNIYIHTHDKVVDLERESYRGGRTEAFKIGEYTGGDFYKVDVNSIYPYVMKIEEWPVKFVNYADLGSVDRIKNGLENGSVIARANVTVGEPALAVKRDKLIFPVGTFEAVLCSKELEWVMSNGRINEVYETAEYETEPIFKEYVDYFYNLKVEKKKQQEYGDYQKIKLLLNSLYGKFGQFNSEFEEVGEAPEGLNMVDNYYNMETEEWVYKIYMSGKEYKKTGEKEAFNTFVGIASEVSASGRMYLWKLIKQAGIDNIWYMDTDSLITNERGMHNLKPYLHPTEIGKLDIEGKTSYLDIRGCKDYQFGDEEKIKGISSKGEKIGTNKWKQDQFLKFRSMLRQPQVSGALVRKVEKELKRQYTKGTVDPSGRVHPLELGS